MAITRHPEPGTILLCDFTEGFKVPEMVKRRPVIIISPRISVRDSLCTVIPLSTQPPTVLMPYHYEIKNLNPPLPPPFDLGPNWVKGDMIVSVGFHRLDLVRYGKDRAGNRTYRFDVLPVSEMQFIRGCVLAGLGLAHLKKFL